jgi:uncharacterized protein
MLSPVPLSPYRTSRVLLASGLLIGSVALGACQPISGGEIPGLKPPQAQRTAATGGPTANPAEVSPPAKPPTKSGSSTGGTARQRNRSLAKNSIYAVDIGKSNVSCRVRIRSPKPPLRDADLAPYGKKLVGCLVKTFAKPLAAHGIDVTTPKVKAYRKTIKTPCGRFGQHGAPAYYCFTTQTIYWPMAGDDGTEAYTYARLGYVGLVAHEFGHHLQGASGMLREFGKRSYAAKSRSARYLLSRRLELQAQCFEGVFLAATAQSIGLSNNDRYQLRVWHSYTGDEDPPRGRKPDHGSSGAQIRWLNRGLDSGDFGRCNTWKASRSSVK